MKDRLSTEWNEKTSHSASASCAAGMRMANIPLNIARNVIRQYMRTAIVIAIFAGDFLPFLPLNICIRERTFERMSALNILLTVLVLVEEYVL